MFLLHQRTQSLFIHGCSFIFNHVHELLPFSAWSHRAGAKTLLPFQSTSTELCSSATRVSSSSLSPASVCDETAVASLLTVLVNTETLMGCSEGTNKSLESFFHSRGTSVLGLLSAGLCIPFTFLSEHKGRT